MPTRLMIGLHLLKHMDGVSDDLICARHLDSPYVQLSCGEAYTQHGRLLDRSSMTRWRQRIGPVIGNMKSDGHLGRNFLLGAEGDAANLILAAPGHNLRLLRTWLARLLAFLLSLLAAPRQTGGPASRDPLAA